MRYNNVENGNWDSFTNVNSMLLRFASEIDVESYFNKWQKQLEKKGIDKNTLMNIYMQDPTFEESNGVIKGQYIDWINTQLKNNYQKLLSEVNTGMLKNNLDLYNRYKKPKNFEDIKTMDVEGLERLILSINDDTFSAKRDMGEKPDYNVLFDNDELTIYKANNYAAAVLFGNEAYKEYGDEHVDNRWCVTQPTSAGQGYYSSVRGTGDASNFFHFKKTDEWFANFGTEFQDVNNCHTPEDEEYSNSFSFINNLVNKLQGEESITAFKQNVNFDIIKYKEAESTIGEAGIKQEGWNCTGAKLANAIDKDDMSEYYRLISEDGLIPDIQCLILADAKRDFSLFKEIEDEYNVPVPGEVFDALREEAKLIAKTYLISATPYTLNYAIESGNIEMVNKILELGVQPDMYTLNYAAKSGNIEVVNRVLELGVQPDNYTLYYATKSGNIEMVNLIQNYIG